MSVTTSVPPTSTSSSGYPLAERTKVPQAESFFQPSCDIKHDYDSLTLLAARFEACSSANGVFLTLSRSPVSPL